MSTQDRVFRPYIFIGIIFIHLGALFGFYYGYGIQNGFSTSAWVVAIFLYVVRLLGVSLGYHRFFTHQSFEASKPVQYVLATSGGLSAQGKVKNWRNDHKRHHAFADREGDPHRPSEYLNRWKSFWWSHVGWLCYETKIPIGYKPPPVALEHKIVVEWQAKWYWVIVVSGFLIPYFISGMDGLFLGGFMCLAFCLNFTWLVNSFCHMIGFHAKARGYVFDTRDARNLPIFDLFGMGEHNHANHHVYQNSAHIGWHWYQSDPAKWVLILLQHISRKFSRKLVWNVKKPEDFLDYDKRLIMQ